MELVDRVVWLPGDRSLDEERLRELQRGLHNGALREQEGKRSQSGTPNRREAARAARRWGRTLCRRLEKDPVMLHLKVSWRSWPGVRSGLGLWNNMQVMPFQSAARTA